MISILMTTYNGEQYLAQQVESVLAQNADDFVLYIQDDCSTDSTWDILQDFARREPKKIIISQTAKNTGGAKYNFYGLMSRVRDNYLMLCDQDDVWLPDKIEKTLTKMHEMEARYGANMPLLVHTDLIVVDAYLQEISPSFKAAMNANYDRTRMQDQLIQNTLTGCTSMYNRFLAELILPQEPCNMVMHDWWLILVASAFGHIGHIEDQTVLYRQHDNNEIGAKDVRTLRYMWSRLLNPRQLREAIAGTYAQAESFLDMYKDKLTIEQNTLVKEYCRIPSKNKAGRWLAVLRLGTFKNGITRNIAYFLFL